MRPANEVVSAPAGSFPSVSVLDETASVSPRSVSAPSTDHGAGVLLETDTRVAPAGRTSPTTTSLAGAAPTSVAVSVSVTSSPAL